MGPIEFWASLRPTGKGSDRTRGRRRGNGRTHGVVVEVMPDPRTREDVEEAAGVLEVRHCWSTRSRPPPPPLMVGVLDVGRRCRS